MTLIELLIALFVLTLISVATYQATTNSFRLRDRLVQENEFITQIRLAVSLVQRDMALMYTPLPLVPPKASGNTSGNTTGSSGSDSASTPSADDNLEAGELSTIGEFFSSAVDKSGIRPTRFTGTEQDFRFITASNIRVYRDSRESDFAEVSYELRRDPSTFKAEGTQILMRLVRPTLFNNDNKEKPKLYPILPGVRSLKLRYYDSTNYKWESAWDSTRQDYKNRYPERIELTLEAESPNGLKFSGVYQIKSEFPINGISNTF